MDQSIRGFESELRISSKPVAVIVALLRSEFQVNYGITSAAAFISVVPLMIVFIFLQRYFMEGLTVGALKG